MNFYCIYHRALNDPNTDIDKLISRTTKVMDKKHKIALEGDLVPMGDDIVLTHKNFTSLKPHNFVKLKEKGLATRLEDVLIKLSPYKDKIWLVLEIKLPMKKRHILKSQELCKKYGFKNVMFDTFIYSKLKHVHKPFLKSKHLYFSIGKVRRQRPLADYIIIPYVTCFGNPKRDYIAGAVNTKKALKNVLKDKKSKGVYLRFKDDSLWKLTLQSLTNRKY